MKGNRWTIRSTEWQAEGVKSVGRPKRLCRDDIEGQQGAVWTRISKDKESWRPLAEGYYGATGSSMDKDSKGQR